MTVCIGFGVINDLPPNGIYVGNLAKHLCGFEEYKNKHMANASTYPYFKEQK